MGAKGNAGLEDPGMPGEIDGGEPSALFRELAKEALFRELTKEGIKI